MRRILLTAIMLLAAGPALAAPPALENQARSAAAAQSCREACRVQASRPGAVPAAAQACFIRCGGGLAATMARQEARPQAQPFSGVGRPVEAVTMPQGIYGVIFAARAPSGAFGMIIGDGDRLAALRTAERRCSAGGPGCRVIAEFTQACGAVAQGVRRAQGALFMTSDPNTYTVTSVSGGSAGNRAAAEADAIAECRSKGPQGTCRIVASQCGAPD
ncbi:DUF4189 domain-containing protein [Roseococcus sp. SYP-B2431]|uniref:DUF4189 domain-containing protein n=1 Tax=Roseococcus sp. SYP-B2431 TaxID=2496640 RepID=UPI0010394D71|nr:DUF4189 domain-containing protein [Roseococcus sp. SYP-B2431]TCH96476.1 DUF4189 domain-containing protein [Roseococcus sp. SYP-B2431]